VEQLRDQPILTQARADADDEFLAFHRSEALERFG